MTTTPGMINSDTPFLEPDGRVRREWFLFLSNLNQAVGGSATVPNLPSITDVLTLQQFDEAIDASPPGFSTVQMAQNNAVLNWLDV